MEVLNDDDHGTKLRRGAAGDRFVAVDREHKVATPVNWKQGDDVIIAGSVSDDDARKIYPQGWKAPKSYIRVVSQPALH
jgi:C-terminal domain of 1-Cys peroxiredoxin